MIYTYFIFNIFSPIKQIAMKAQRASTCPSQLETLFLFVCFFPEVGAENGLNFLGENQDSTSQDEDQQPPQPSTLPFYSPPPLHCIYIYLRAAKETKETLTTRPWTMFLLLFSACPGQKVSRQHSPHPTPHCPSHQTGATNAQWFQAVQIFN